MSATASELLHQAHELIEEGEYSRARELIEPLIFSHRDNPNVWWIYAHAVEDAEDGKYAMENLLSLDPNYPGAYDVAQEIQAQYPDFAIDQPFPARPQPPLPAELAGVGVQQASTDTAAYDESESKSSGISPLLLFLIAILIILAIGVVLFSVRDQFVPVSAPTGVANETPVPFDSQSVDTSITVNLINVLNVQLESLDTRGIEITDTVLGRTVLVQACSIPGPPASQTLNEIMTVMAAEAESLSQTTSALGVTIIECATSNAALNNVVVPIQDAIAFSNGDISSRDFEMQWQPVN